MADPKNLEDVRALFARRKNELIAKYHACGAGVGRNDAGDYAIVIYLESAREGSEPVWIEGVPLKFEVTGPIRPLQH